MSEKTVEEIQKALAAPFTKVVNGKTYPNEKWLTKALTAKKDKYFCFAYLDRELVINRLNDVLGINGWQFNVVREADGTRTGTLSICINGEWFDRSDTGTETTTESGKLKEKIDKEKAATSDALKRCATQFGIGTYIYSMNNKFVNAKVFGNKTMPTDGNGRPLYGNQVSDFINGMSIGQGLIVPLLSEFPSLFQRPEIKLLWGELQSYVEPVKTK